MKEASVSFKVLFLFSFFFFLKKMVQVDKLMIVWRRSAELIICWIKFNDSNHSADVGLLVSN